jgi:hypothetical protein
LNIDFSIIKVKKIDSKEVKNYISFLLDLDSLVLTGDKGFKLYTVKMINNSYDYLICGTNRGLMILKITPAQHSEAVFSSRIYELNSKLSFFEMNRSKLFEKKATLSGHKYINETLALQDVFSNVTYSKFDLKFSHNQNYLSVIDIHNSNYVVFEVSISDDLRMYPTSIKNGICTQLEWCPFDSIYATTQSSITKGVKGFTLCVYRIVESSLQHLYTIEE